LDAKKAWIVFPSSREPLEIIPLVKKIVNTDSEVGEYSYDVEFVINPTHELENNTF
jgi:hypothetical protein